MNSITVKFNYVGFFNGISPSPVGTELTLKNNTTNNIEILNVYLELRRYEYLIFPTFKKIEIISSTPQKLLNKLSEINIAYTISNIYVNSEFKHYRFVVTTKYNEMYYTVFESLSDLK